MARKAFEPTAEQTKQVEQMASVGIPQEQIAMVLGITVKTLYKYFRETLDKAMVLANVAVAQSLFLSAIKGNPAAQIFWCKTRLGWKETSVTEHALPGVISDKPLTAEEWIDKYASGGTPDSLESTGGSAEGAD